MPYVNLEYIAPDYKFELLEMSPNLDIPTDGAYVQVLNDTDGGNPKVVTMKTTPDNIVNLTFKGLTKAKFDTLNSLYNAPTKALGMANSFVWRHPETLNLYAVHFISGFKFTSFTYGLYEVSFSLKILGFAAVVNVKTFGSTIDFLYGGTASFYTLYEDGTYDILSNPILKTFSTAGVRNTVVLTSDNTLVTLLQFAANNVSSITPVSFFSNLENLYLYDTFITDTPDVTENISLVNLYLNGTLITVPPDVSNNIDLEHLYLNNTLITIPPVVTYNTTLFRLTLQSTLITAAPNVTTNTLLEILYLHATAITVAPDVTNNTGLVNFYVHECNITEASLSACVTQMWGNRVQLGVNACLIRLEDNNGLTADAIARIEGTGTYSGDGLKDAGCTVTY